MRKVLTNLYKGMTTRQRLLTFQAAFILILFSLVYIYSATFYTDILLENEKKNLIQYLQVVNENISAELENFEQVALDAQISSGIKKNLNKTDYVEYGRAYAQVMDYLNTKTLGTNGLRYAVVIDNERHVYSLDLPLRLPDTFDLKSTKVYQAVQDRPGELVWLSSNDIYDSYSLVQGDYRIRSDIHAAALLKNYTTGEVLGILILTLDSSFFQRLNYLNEDAGDEGLYLVSPDHEKFYALSGSAENISPGVYDRLGTESGLFGDFTLGDELISYRYNGAMGWRLVSVTQMHTLRERVSIRVKTLLIPFGIALLIFLVLSSRFFNSMTRGISKLSQGMKQFETGDFEVRVEYPESDEIGRLSETFNHMADQINDLIDSQYRMTITTQEAEFKSLQAQINPHFLYNTLDMLNWQLVMRGEDELSESVVALGNCLRYSISRDSVYVTLADEVENVRDYLRVQSSVSEKKVDFVLQVEDADKITVPRLTLQPLVENIFVHGFIGRKDNNKLCVIGGFEAPDQDSYSIEISDNGIGIQEEQLHSLFEDADDHLHVGLNNVRQRLKYMYKESAEVTVESNYGYGTTVRIRLFCPLDVVQT